MTTRFLSKLLHRWYLYLIPVLLFPVVATIYGQNHLSVYQSTALVYVGKPPYVSGGSSSGFNPYITPAQNGANALNELLQSESFVVTIAGETDLAKQYDLKQPAQQDAVFGRVSQEVAVKPTGVGENTFIVTASDKSAHIAQQLADVLVKQFFTYFTQRQLQQDAQAETFLTQQLTQARNTEQQDAARVSEYLQSHPELRLPGASDPTLTQLQQQYNQDVDTVKQLNDTLTSVRYNEAAITTGTSNQFTVLDEPKVALKPTLHLSKLAVYTGGGLAMAVALLALIVGTQTLLDRRIYTTQDVRTLTEAAGLDIPAIEAVPVLRGIGQTSTTSQDDPSITGVLKPVLTALPRLGDGQMEEKLRQAVGVASEDEE